MVLHLEVTRHVGLPPEQPASLNLEKGACQLGRSADNDLVLTDPERMVSGHHARIELRDGAFWLTDLSTNGTFLNQSRERLEPNRPVALNDGDTLLIGPYELSVSIESDAIASPADPFGLDDQPLPGMEQPGRAADIMELLGGGGTGPADRDHPPAEDPFADAQALDPFLSGPVPEDQGPRAAEPRLTPVEHVHFRPPDTAPIPEGYDLLADELLPPVPGRLAEPGQSGPPLGPSQPSADSRQGEGPPLTDADLGWGPEPPAVPDAGPPGPAFGREPQVPEAPERPAGQAGSPPPPRADVPQPPAPAPSPESARPIPRGTNADALSALFAGLGIGDPPPVKDPEALLRDTGALLRTLTAGLTTTMMARAQFKSELRLGVTTIRRAENNPFKFSASTDEALERLLLRPNPAFLPALDAAEEAFEDIQAHEMAMIAGLRAALRALLARFEPSALEARLGSASGLDRLLPMARRSRYWELFNETYGQVATDAAEDFMQLFGEAFAHAYEDQILRLAQARRSNRERPV